MCLSCPHLLYILLFEFLSLIIICFPANKFNLYGKKTSLEEQTVERWKHVLFGNLYFLKGHSVSVLSKPRALVSAVSNWPLVSCSWCEWSSSCICLPPRPSKALVSSEQLWLYFQIKCHLLAPISADKCPQSQVEGRLGPTAHSSTDFWKEQKASASSFFFYFSPLDFHYLTVSLYSVSPSISLSTNTNMQKTFSGILIQSHRVLVPHYSLTHTWILRLIPILIIETEISFRRLVFF